MVDPTRSHVGGVKGTIFTNRDTHSVVRGLGQEVLAVAFGPDPALHHDPAHVAPAETLAVRHILPEAAHFIIGFSHSQTLVVVVVIHLSTSQHPLGVHLRQPIEPRMPRLGRKAVGASEIHDVGSDLVAHAEILLGSHNRRQLGRGRQTARATRYQKNSGACRNQSRDQAEGGAVGRLHGGNFTLLKGIFE